jgi:Tautomerase enzyme
MPLVRIAFLKGKPTGFGKQVAGVVYRTMIDTIDVPPKDNFQLITPHDGDTFVYDPEYLDIRRTGGLVIIQITLNEGRSVELKKVFYRGPTPASGTRRATRRRVGQPRGGEEGELVLRKRDRPVRGPLVPVRRSAAEEVGCRLTPPRPPSRAHARRRRFCGPSQ